MPHPYSYATKLYSAATAQKSAASGAQLAAAAALLHSSLPWGWEESDDGAAEGGEVPWGPAAKGPDTGGEGVRDLWGALCGWEGDETR